MKDKTSLGISDILRNFIEGLVESVLIKGEPFDKHKKWLKKYSDLEGVDYAALESNLNDFFKTVKELEEDESNVVECSAQNLAKDCYLSEDMANRLIEKAAAIRVQKEEEAAKAEAERIAAVKKAEEERVAREKAERIAAEKKAKRKAREEKKKALEAERKAKEDAERKAKEEEERKAKRQMEYNAKILGRNPFCRFPQLSKELMNLNFNEYAYSDVLEKILAINRELYRLLLDEDVKQSSEYTSFSSTANDYLARAKNIQRAEIEPIKKEGEQLVNKGRTMRHMVQEKRKEIASRELTKKRTWIAVIFTVIPITILCLLIWLLFVKKITFRDSPAIVQIVGGLFTGIEFMLLFIIPFWWSNDFRKE